MSRTMHCSYCGSEGVNMNTCPFLLIDYNSRDNGEYISPRFDSHNPRGIRAVPHQALARSSLVPRKKQHVPESLKLSRGIDYTNAMKVQDLLEDKRRLALFAEKLIKNSEDIISEYERDIPFDYRPYVNPYHGLMERTANFIERMNGKNIGLLWLGPLSHGGQ
jgi:hypothetical protein